jgi:hypothetical protein
MCHSIRTCISCQSERVGFSWSQEVIYDVGIPWTTCLAMPLVITSVIVHSMYPPAKKVDAKVKKS